MRTLARLRRVGTVALVAASMSSARPALADDEASTGSTAGAYINQQGDPTAKASQSASVPGSGGASPSDCNWVRMDASTNSVIYDENGQRINSPTGRWLQKVCDGSPVAVGGVFAVPEQPTDPRRVAREARQSVSIPEPVLATSPAIDRRLYVQMPTWLWLDPSWWKAYSATASTGGVSATVVARPVRTIWSMGDGRQTVCGGPGVAWRRGLPESAATCAYTYTRSSDGQQGGTFTLGVTVEFAISWTATTGAAGTLPPITRTASRQVTVGEIQAVETG